MSFEAPPIMDDKGRIRRIKPVGSDQPDLSSGLNDLMFAAAHGRVDTINLLLDAGADVDARSKMHDSTALGIAVANGQVGAVKVLVERGADVSMQCIGGQTPLVYAAANAEFGMVKALLDLGADVNAADGTGGTPLMWAVAAGRADVVEMLLDAGADVNARDNNGYTALSLVPNKKLLKIPLLGEFYSDKRNEQITRLLKEAGAES